MNERGWMASPMASLLTTAGKPRSRARADVPASSSDPKPKKSHAVTAFRRRARPELAVARRRRARRAARGRRGDAPEPELRRPQGREAEAHQGQERSDVTDPGGARPAQGGCRAAAAGGRDGAAYEPGRRRCDPAVRAHRLGLVAAARFSRRRFGVPMRRAQEDPERRDRAGRHPRHPRASRPAALRPPDCEGEGPRLVRARVSSGRERPAPGRWCARRTEAPPKRCFTCREILRRSPCERSPRRPGASRSAFLVLSSAGTFPSLRRLECYRALPACVQHRARGASSQPRGMPRTRDPCGKAQAAPCAPSPRRRDVRGRGGVGRAMPLPLRASAVTAPRGGRVSVVLRPRADPVRDRRD